MKLTRREILGSAGALLVAPNVAFDAQAAEPQKGAPGSALDPLRIPGRLAPANAPWSASSDKPARPLPPPRKEGRSTALREFLTLRRAQIPPSAVGLKSTKTRRSGGLTREDMAELTGVSFKWYTLFESGAAKGVSRKFAERVVGVLGLNATERHFLLSLMGFADNGVAASLPVQVPPNLVRLVQKTEGVAAALYSPLMDVLEANAAYAAFFPLPPAGGPNPTFARNNVWRLFMDPEFRAIWCDWEAVAAGMLADFRYTSAAVRHTAEYGALMEALSQSPDFARIWGADDSARMGDLGGRLEMRLPGGQHVALNMTVLQAAGAAGVYLAALVRESAAR